MTRSLSISCFRAVNVLPLLLALAAWSAPALAVVDVPDNFIHETLVTGLSEPVNMAFLPDGRLLVIEKVTGKVRLVVNGNLATPDPVMVMPSVYATGYERGMQGIAVDSRWPESPYLYFVHNRVGGYLRLVRYTASGALTDPNSGSLTLGTPLILIDDIPDAAHNHNGGTLRFGLDDHLYLSIGEDADQCAAQDSTKLKGNILRIRVTGLPTTGGGPVPRAMIIPTTPALASSDSNAKLVYAYGLRNPWRFAMDAQTGIIYQGDVGEGTYEELDEIHAGDNLGWPYREGAAVRSPGTCSEPGGSGHGSYDAPLLTVNHSVGVQAILAAFVYRPVGGAATWPMTYHGSLFYSDFATGWLRRLTKSGVTWSPSAAVSGQPNASDWATGFTSPVAFELGPDGSLYCLSLTGSLSRIRYTGIEVADVPRPPDRGVALRGAPNPFASSTLITFTLAGSEPVRLTVFDARGRRMRTLLEDTSGPGEMRVSWDGNDDRGHRLSSGFYYLRLEHGGAVETARVLRLQ